MHENGQLKGAEEEIVTEIDTVAGIICIEHKKSAVGIVYVLYKRSGLFHRSRTITC